MGTITKKVATKKAVKRASRVVKKAVLTNNDHLELDVKMHLFDGVNLETKWNKTHGIETLLNSIYPVGSKPKIMDCEVLSYLLTSRFNNVGLSYKGDIIDIDNTIDLLRARNKIVGVKLAYLQYYNGVLSSFFKGLDDVSNIKPYAGKAQGLQILTALKSIRDEFEIFNFKLVS